MMNTWFTDIVRSTNEQILPDADLARIMAYYATVPARLRLSEELERLEPNFVKNLQVELSKRHSDRSLYNRRFTQDIVESLRHLNRSVLADDPRLLRCRWIDHLLEVTAATNTDPAVVRDAYVALRDLLERQLPRSAWDVLEPAYTDLLDALTRGSSPTL